MVNFVANLLKVTDEANFMEEMILLLLNLKKEC